RNGTSTSATSTNFFTTNLTATNLVFTNLVATNSTTTNATTTNFAVTGTGTTTFNGDILAPGIAAGRYLTAPNIFATSTTAVNYFAGTVGIGTSSLAVNPSQKVYIQGQGNTYTDKIFRLDNSSSNPVILASGDGRVFIGNDSGHNASLIVNKGTKTDGDILDLADSIGTMQINSSQLFSTSANISMGSNGFGDAFKIFSPGGNNILNIRGTSIGVNTSSP